MGMCKRLPVTWSLPSFCFVLKQRLQDQYDSRQIENKIKILIYCMYIF